MEGLDPEHKCGVVVVVGKPGSDVVPDMLRLTGEHTHRGQKAGGVAVSHSGEIWVHHVEGPFRDHVDSLLGAGTMPNTTVPPAASAVGHTRYGTSDPHTPDHLSIAHPMVVSYKDKLLAFLFNGNVPNFSVQRKELVDAGIEVTSQSDTEVIAKLIALRWSVHGDIVEAIRSLKDLQGGFSCAVLLPGGDAYAFRDNRGMRPLSLFEHRETGKQAVVSEGHAIAKVWGNGVTSSDVGAGELIHLSPGRPVERIRLWEPENPAHCFFEVTYFCRRASAPEGVPVDLSRRLWGEHLAQDDRDWKDDRLVIPVPNTANSVAQGYADISGQPYVEYIGRKHEKNGRPSEKRTFIEEGDYIQKVRDKFIFRDNISIEGQNVLLVEDSIVRSNTMKALVSILREKKPRSIHARIACPPITGPCYYGINFTTMDELFAPKHHLGPLLANGTMPQTGLDTAARALDLQSLKYLPVSAVVEVMGKSRNGICMACVDGQHPYPHGQQLYDLELAKFKKAHIDG